MTKSLYIAGPMTGLPEYNYPAFNTAARDLRDAGYTVLNPAETEPPAKDPTWQDWMRAAIALLIQADAIATLPGWQQSRGARVEIGLASSISMTINTTTGWLNQAAIQREIDLAAQPNWMVP